MSFDVPTLPLFVHERLSTKAILETLKGHERDQQMEIQLYTDPQLPLHQQLEAYEHKGGWVNRMILGDALVVMNSLLEYEGLGEQVQTIYIDPPYGVKFGSNFQPFVRERDVKNNDDADMTREPEMVKAYRDTWELGLHSYLTYLRDRLLVARDLLTPQEASSSRSMTRTCTIYGAGSTNFRSGELSWPHRLSEATGGVRSAACRHVADYLLWYAKDKICASGFDSSIIGPKVRSGDERGNTAGELRDGRSTADRRGTRRRRLHSRGWRLRRRHLTHKATASIRRSRL